MHIDKMSKELKMLRVFCWTFQRAPWRDFCWEKCFLITHIYLITKPSSVTYNNMFHKDKILFWLIAYNLLFSVLFYYVKYPYLIINYFEILNTKEVSSISHLSVSCYYLFNFLRLYSYTAYGLIADLSATLMWYGQAFCSVLNK